ncbi:MAG TPA: TraR/DksA C4-type zinc finger protein [Acidimicrobiales bacterium]
MDPDEARRQLAAERDRLVAVRVGFDDEGLDSSQTDSFGELASYDQHQADIGTETFEREKDLSIIERVEAELADVEHALRRLDEGTYGLCEACGRPIDEARLDAIPAARLCLDDQATAERQARFGA